MGTPTVTPTKFRAGTTVKWTLDPGDDFRPAATWALAYRFNNGTAVTSVSATNAGDGTFLVTMSATVTGGMAAGDYTYSAIVTKGTEVFEVDAGTVTVEPSFTTATEGRSFAKQMLDLIEAGIKLKATNSPDVAAYTIAGRSLQKWTYEQLRVEASHWRRKYQAECRDERVAKGLPAGGRILTEFRS